MSEMKEISRSEWIRTRMEQGYKEMGPLNLELSEEGLEADQIDFAIYEKVLLESE